MTETRNTYTAPANQTALEQFAYDDGIVRKFAWATIIWAIVAMLVGLFIALQLAFPVLNLGIEYFSFGRLRPLHTNAAIFAFAGNAIFAAIYYSTQRLCKARMYSDMLSKLHFWGWQLIIVLAAVTLPLGITQGKEYAELEWPIDLLIAVVWLGFFGVNFFMTLIKRRERHMYVALWFYIATIVTVTILHVFNSLVIPMGLFKSYPIYAGVQDAFVQWWYGHNAVAFFLTTPFLGLMYYYLPKAADRPVFSYRLSIIHFWSLVFIYIWAGPHHLHYTAIPSWMSSLGMIFSVMLWMPSWGGMLNGLLTLRGAWHKVTTDPVLKFFVVAITFYGMSTFEGAMLSVKMVNSLSHYTDWTIGHVHSGALGWNGFLAFGMLYWLAPRLFQVDKLYSTKLANLHFWLATAGILVYIISMYVAGLTQGLMWRELDAQGGLANDFMKSVTAIVPMYYIRALGGGMYLAGVLIGAFNFFKTWQGRPAQYEEVVHEAPPLSATYQDPPEPTSRLTGVTNLGHRLDVWFQAAWHRRWERLPIRFTVWVVIAVVAATLFEAIPTFIIRSNIPTISTVQPYTPLEVAGRDIYIAEGCYNCHSQMIRPILAETKRYGDYSRAGEFVYDHPFQWGSRRIGPDLARVGSKYTPLWHIQHFRNPNQFTQGSLMPRYTWLFEQDIDFKAIPKRIKALSQIGVPYDKELDEAENMARSQARQIAEFLESKGEQQGLENKKVIALTAYLLRLGKDIYADDKPSAETATNTNQEQPTTGGE